MAPLNIGICVLCASLSVVVSIPLSLPSSKKLSLPTKMRLPKSNNRLLAAKLKTTTESTKDNADKLEPNGGSQLLASITDSMPDDFTANETIDYDSMSIPEPERVVPVLPPSPFSDLSYKEMHERAQFMRISEVKESILDKLRLLAPPNITALKLNNKLKKYPDHIVPKLEQPIDFQQDSSHSAPDDFHAKISTVIQFASDFPLSKHPDMYPVESIAYFSLPMTVSEKNVQKATFMIYIATPFGAAGQQIQLIISNTLFKNKPFVDRTVNLTSRGHWEHIDISELVRDWAADDSQNYGLFVSALLNGKNIAYLHDDPTEVVEKVFLPGDITSQPHRTPLIKIILDEQQGRYKRAFNEVPSTCDIKQRENRCCRYKFVIDFDKLGKDFDFIMEPRRYLANYCAGSCPTYYLPSDGHSKLMMALRRPKLQRCCTAVTKIPLSLLYYNDDGGIMLGKIPDMSIEKCRCS